MEIYLSDGIIKSSPWGEAFFLPQMIWGIIFTKIFGFSFTILRLSQILITILGIFIFYKILSKLTECKYLIFLGSFCLLFNPIVFSQTNTFQTDIPLMVLSLFSFHYYLVFLSGNHTYNHILSVIFAVIAILLKQTGIAIAFTYFICNLLFMKKRSFNLLKSSSTLLSLILIIPLYNIISELYNILPSSHNFMSSQFFNIITRPEVEDLKRLSYYTVNTLLSFGIFISPFSLVCFFKYSHLAPDLFPKFRNKLYICLTGFIIIILKNYYSGTYLPFSGNILYDIGLGPIIMTGIDQNIIPNIPKLGINIWTLISYIGFSGIISFFYLIKIFIKIIKTISISKIKLLKYASTFSCLYSIIYILPFLIVNANIRYTNVILPFIIIAMISIIECFKLNNIHLAAKNYCHIKIFSTIIAIFSIIATHDYFSFQTTRWKALNDLSNIQLVPAEMIDGGFEFNEYHFSDIYDVWEMTADQTKKGRFWPIVEDQYIVTVVNIDNYSLHKKYNYKRLLPYGNYSINVLKKTN